jgi:hypothetical protein
MLEHASGHHRPRTLGSTRPRPAPRQRDARVIS